MAITEQVEEQIHKDFNNIINTHDATVYTDSIEETLNQMNDLTSINTFGYEMRRYLAKNYTQFFTEVNIPEDTNKWDDQTLKVVKNNIALFYKDLGDTRDKNDIGKEWNKWLSNVKTPERYNILKVTFDFHMSYNDTLKLLLASGEEPFDPRNPMELIMYFCKRSQESSDLAVNNYDYQDVLDLVNRYLDGIKGKDIETVNVKKKNYLYQNHMTQLITNKVTDLHNSGMTNADKENELIEFMIDECNAFTSKTKSKKVSFEHGYSLERRTKYFELTKYLAVMYPRYELVEDDSETINSTAYGTDDYEGVYKLIKAIFTDNSVAIGYDKKKNLPDLRNLVRAMMDSNQLDMEVSKEQEKLPFGKSVMSFIKDYYTRIGDIYNGKEGVSRKDVLLFAYFFVAGYLLSDNQEELKNELYKVNDKTNQTQKFVNKIIDLTESKLTIDGDEMQIGYTKNIINSFLEEFNYIEFPLYTPLPFDRFIYLSILLDFDEDFDYAPLITYLQYDEKEKDEEEFLKDLN